MSLTHNKVVTCQKTQQASPLTQLSDFAYNFDMKSPNILKRTH
jgi:hypothetical protein